MKTYKYIEAFPYGGQKNLLPAANNGDRCGIIFRFIWPDAPDWARDPDEEAGTVYRNVHGRYSKITTLKPDQRHPYGDVI